MAAPSRTLNAQDAAIIRALLYAGMAQHDVASLFGCNAGRVAEVNTGKRFPAVPPADLNDPVVMRRLLAILAGWSKRVTTEVIRAMARRAE